MPGQNEKARKTRTYFFGTPAVSNLFSRIPHPQAPTVSAHYTYPRKICQEVSFLIYWQVASSPMHSLHHESW